MSPESLARLKAEIEHLEKQYRPAHNCHFIAQQAEAIANVIQSGEFYSIRVEVQTPRVPVWFFAHKNDLHPAAAKHLKEAFYHVVDFQLEKFKSF